MPAIAAAPLFWGSVVAGGAGLGAAAIGARAQGNAAKRAAAVQSQSDTDAIELARQQMEQEQRQWEAMQAFERDKFRAAEEDRVYQRSLSEAAERRLAARDAQLVPYRQAGVRALGRLSDLAGRGQFEWRSPSQMGRVSLSDLVRS